MIYMPFGKIYTKKKKKMRPSFLIGRRGENGDLEKLRLLCPLPPTANTNAIEPAARIGH